jgi:hypothetical protein
MSGAVLADGSAVQDRRAKVEIDRTNKADRWRYRCPRGHTNWAQTNSHLWCQSCRRQAEAGEDVDPEWYEIVDERTGEKIPWSAVEVRE